MITTNLDNDDCLHREALASVKAAVMRERRTGLYVLTYGYQYLKSKNMMLKMRYPHNHFMSLCENLDNGIRTIEFESHGKMRRLVDFVYDIDTRPYWIEIVHARNYANDVRVTSRIRYGIPASDECWDDFVPGGVFGGIPGRLVTALSFAVIFVKWCFIRGVRKLSRVL